MTGIQQPLLIVACIALFALLLALWQLLVVRQLRREMKQLREQLAAEPEAEAKLPISFSTSLDSAEREQLQAAPPVMPRNSAEKYRYVGSLAEQGLDAKGIAEALQMPTAEVEQLLRLAKLKPASSSQ